LTKRRKWGGKSLNTRIRERIGGESGEGKGGEGGDWDSTVAGKTVVRA